MLNRLSTYEVSQLTCFLVIPPGLDISSSYFHTHQRKKIAELPSSLRKPVKTLPTLMHKLYLYTPKHKSEALCATHVSLNVALIHSLFNSIETEVTVHVRRFVEINAAEKVSECVKEWLVRVKMIETLLTLDNSMHRTRLSTDVPRIARLESTCEACILALIGGRADVLIDLRNCIVSRQKRVGDFPRLLRYIEAWMAGFDNVNDLMQASSSMGVQVRNVRKFLHKNRQKQKHARAEKSSRALKASEEDIHGAKWKQASEQNTGDDHGSTYDAEQSIFDMFLDEPDKLGANEEHISVRSHSPYNSYGASHQNIIYQTMAELSASVTGTSTRDSSQHEQTQSEDERSQEDRHDRPISPLTFYSASIYSTEDVTVLPGR